MTHPDMCEMTLLVQADFDGELDAGEAARVEAHRAVCPTCRTTYEELACVRAALRDGAFSQTTTSDFRARLKAKMAPSAPVRRSRPYLVGIGSAMAAALAVLLIVPRPNHTGDALLDEVVTGHIRSLQPGHLQDVASTDRHTVKPWFNGRIDFAPPVKDFAEQGFPLRGGRLDAIAARPVAALVYERGSHPINVFVWPSTQDAVAPHPDSRNGYNILRFTTGEAEVWMISDLESAELAHFGEMWRAAP